MRYGLLAIVQVSTAAVTAAASIAAAVLRPDATSLAIGTVAGAAWNTSLLWFTAEWRPSLPRKSQADIRSLLRFGANVTGFNIVNYLHRRLDDVLIGFVWGPRELGLYNRAYSLLMLPILNLRAPLNSVAIPAMSQLIDEPPRYRSYFLRYCQILAFASMPPIAIAATCSDALMRTVLGPEWTAAGDIFLFLAIGGLIQPVAGARGLILLSAGKGGRYFRWGLANAIATSASFCIGAPWGACGVAAAYSACGYLILHPSLIYACDGSSVRPSDFYRAIKVPFIAAAGAALTFAWLRPLLGVVSDIAIVTAAISLGGTLFLVFSALFPSGRAFFWEGISEIRRYILRMRWAA
jgi:PST family polysaccharide transporter